MNAERKFSATEILLSTTDLDGCIKYANQNFCNIAGYASEEMVGQPHNLVRHSDMPKAAFKDLWSYVRSGKPWMGIVKNKCKNGDHYWVNAFVTPIKDHEGKTYEYQSVRSYPERSVVERAQQLYPKIEAGQIPLAAKTQTDITLWLQIMLVLLLILSTVAVAVAQHSLWFTYQV